MQVHMHLPILADIAPTLDFAMHNERKTKSAHVDYPCAVVQQLSGCDPRTFPTVRILNLKVLNDLRDYNFSFPTN